MSGECLPLHGCVVHLGHCAVRRPGEERSLTPLEVALLRYLASHTDRPVSHAELLVEVWGYRPGVESRAVVFAVQRLRAKIEEDPKKPVNLVTVRGVGFRLVLTDPAVPPGFFGRERELAALAKHLGAAQGPVAVVGPGGVGKTTFVREYMRRTGGRSVFCDLRQVGDHEGLLRAVAERLELPLAQGFEALRERVRGALKVREDLWVLDNAEHLCPQVATWIADWEGPQLLLTSRLAVEGWQTLRLGELSARAGASLFAYRVALRRPGWSPRGRGELVDELVALLKGHPLALELVAARAGVLSLTELRDRLRQSLAPEALGLLQATVAWSWALLGPQERRALAWCSVFQGPFTGREAEGVLASSVGDPLGVLSALEDHSLLNTMEREGARWLVLHLGVQAYAAEALTSSGERAEAEAAHARCLLSWSDELPPDRWLPHTVALLLRRLPELLVIQERFVERDPPLAARALVALLSVIHQRVSLRRQVRLLQDTLRALEAPHALLLAELGYCLWRVGELAPAQRAIEASLAAHGSSWARARAEAVMGMTLQGAGGVAEAESWCRRSLARVQRLGQPSREAMGLTNLAINLSAQGRLAEAEELLLQAQELEVEGQHAVMVQNNLANLCVKGGRYEEARGLYERALSMARATKDRQREGVILGNLGAVLLNLGATEEAARVCEQAVAWQRRSGHRVGVGLALSNLGRVQHLSGQLTEAERSIRRGVGLLESSGHRARASWYRMFQAAVWIDLGQPAAARRAERRAEELAVGEGDPCLRALVGAHWAVRGAESGEGSVAAAEAAVAALRAHGHEELAARVRWLEARLRAI